MINDTDQPDPYSANYPGTLQDNPAADQNGPGSPLWNAIVQMYVSATGKGPSSDDVVRQLIKNYGGADGLGEIQKQIYASPEAQTYGSGNPYRYDPATGMDVPKDPSITPPDPWSTAHPFGTNINPPATGGGGSGGSGGSGGGGGAAGGGGNTLPSPFDSPFVAPDRIPLPNAPVFTPPAERIAPAFQGLAPFTGPTWNAPAPFTAPTMAEVLADPGYQMPLQQGLGAINNSRAAQGLWGTGATGKALNDYAQNYANTFYGNIYNRDASTYGLNWDNAYKSFTTDYGNKANEYQTNEQNLLNTYNTNYQTQYKDPNTYDYTAAVDAFKPQILQYTTNAADIQHQNDTNWTNAYNIWDTLFKHKYDTAGFLRDTAAL